MGTQQQSAPTFGQDAAQSQVTRRLGSSAAHLKGQTSNALSHFAEAVLQVGQQFRAENRGIAGQYAERTAGQVQRLSHYLQHTEVDELVREIERVARQRPAAYLGAAFTLGLFTARFLRSSRRQHAGGLELQPTDAVGAHAGAGADFSLGATGGAPAVERDVTGLRPVNVEGVSPIDAAAGGLAPSATGSDVVARPDRADHRLR